MCSYSFSGLAIKISCGHFVDRKIASKMDNMLTGDLAKYLCFGELMEDSGLNKRDNG